MSKLPALSNWETTAHNLHQAAQVMGALHMLLIDRKPNYLELPMQIVPTGLVGGAMPIGGTIRLDFEQAALIYTPDTGAAQSLPLAGTTQAALFETVLATLANAGYDVTGKTGTHASYTDAYWAALTAKAHRTLPAREEYGGTTDLTVDIGLAADYANALYTIFTGVARFRARLNGPMTPVVVWPEHFDLSFLWFASDDFNESASHMSFGFAPFSPNMPRPYLYSYAYPYPDGYAGPSHVPAPAYWSTEDFTGIAVLYDDMLNEDDPAAFVEAMFMAIYRDMSTIF